jgi:hypothetical protein
VVLSAAAARARQVVELARNSGIVDALSLADAVKSTLSVIATSGVPCKGEWFGGLGLVRATVPVLRLEAAPAASPLLLGASPAAQRPSARRRLAEPPVSLEDEEDLGGTPPAAGGATPVQASYLAPKKLKRAAAAAAAAQRRAKRAKTAGSGRKGRKSAQANV